MILIAGSTGLAGSAIYRKCVEKNLDVVGVSSKNFDLLDRKSTFAYLKKMKPEIVIDAAAKAGGIGVQNRFPVKFLSENLQIQVNLMDACHEVGVQKFVFLGSSCIYPRDCRQPIKEEYLLSGKLETTNSAYAIAKIAGIELVNSYRKQFSNQWINLMPTNLYGPNDNFDIETGHVIPALISKFSKAKSEKVGEIRMWGSGAAMREFLYVDDLADAVLFCISKFNEFGHLNVGTGTEILVRDLVHLIKTKIGFSGEILWNDNNLDGTPRKLMDSSKLKDMGWTPKITLDEGLDKTIEWFSKNILNNKKR